MSLKKKYLLSLALSTILFSFATGAAGQSGDLSWVGAWQYGTSEAVAVDTVRSYAYLGSGGAIRTFDISDPGNPVQLDQSIRTSGQILDIHVDYADQNLLLACDEAGLQIWDVDDVENPSQISSIEIIYGGVETPVRHVELYQDFAVTENEWGYVHTVDISDPANPFQVAFNGVMGNPAHDISVSADGYIHATGQQYFVLLQIEPDGSLDLVANYYFNAGSVFGTTDASFLSLNGNLHIINRSGGPSGSVPVSFHDIVVKGDNAFLIGDSTFMIYDVSDLGNPYFVSQVTVSDFTSQLDIIGNNAVISCAHEGMKIVDFTDQSDPVEVSSIVGTGVSWASQLDGGYSYIANSSTGISVIDISNPVGNNPEKVAGIGSNGETRDLVIEDDILYFADYDGGLRIYDISDPLNPAYLDDIPNINAWRVDASDDELYVDIASPNNPDELRIYDISNPGTPVQLSNMNLPDLIFEVLFYEDHLYVAAFDSGMLVIDVSNPSNPTRVATVSLPDVSDIDIENDTAYVASTDWNGGLVTVDISDPADPQVLNIYNPSGWYHPFHVAVSGDFAYTSENFGQLKMFDISDPLNPQELDEYVTSGSVVHMMADGNYLYVADGPDGLHIMHNNLGSVSASFSADNQNVCDGETVNYTDLSSGGVVSWEWTFEGGTPGTSSQQNPAVTYNDTGDYDVELIVSDGINYDTVVETDYISVSTIPAQAGTPAGPAGTCQGGSYEYTISPVTYATTYTWMLDPADAGTLQGNGTTASFEADTTWTGTYTIEVQASNSCGDGAWSPPLTAVLNDTPEQYTLSGGGDYCEGTGGLELTLDGSETGVDYELFLDDGSTGMIEPGTGSPISFGNHTDEGYYTVIAFNANCEQEMAGENYINMQAIPEQPATPVGDQMPCNDMVSLYSTEVVEDADTYNWVLSPEPAGTLFTDSTSAEVDWNADFTGTAMLSVSAGNECGDGAGSDPLVITVLMAPEPAISGPDSVCAGSSAIYVTEDNPGSTYDWEVAGGEISSGDSTHQVTVQWDDMGPGTLSVTEETGEGCSAAAEEYEVMIYECLAIDEKDAGQPEIFPNPARESIYLDFERRAGGKMTILVYNISGQPVVEKHIETHRGRNVEEIHLKGLSPGLYLLKLLNSKNAEVVASRFVKN